MLKILSPVSFCPDQGSLVPPLYIENFWLLFLNSAEYFSFLLKKKNIRKLFGLLLKMRLVMILFSFCMIDIKDSLALFLALC